MLEEDNPMTMCKRLILAIKKEDDPRSSAFQIVGLLAGMWKFVSQTLFSHSDPERLSNLYKRGLRY
jgi:hypothetical protein